MLRIRQITQLAAGMTSILVLLNLIANPNAAQAAALSGCPNQWSITMPTLTVQDHEGTITSDSTYNLYFAGTKYQFFNSSYGTLGVHSNSLGILSFYLPELYSYLKSLGRNAVYSTRYEFSSDQNFKNLIPEIDTPPFPTSANNLQLNLGITNGTYMRASINVAVSGCSQSSNFYSNSYQFTNLQEQPESLDDYFQAEGKQYNFQQETIIRSYLETVKKSLSSSIIGNIWQSPVGHLVFIGGGPNFEWIPVAISPQGCLTPNNPSSWPHWSPVSINFSYLPCKLGIVVTGTQIPLNQSGLNTLNDSFNYTPDEPFGIKCVPGDEICISNLELSIVPSAPFTAPMIDSIMITQPPLKQSGTQNQTKAAPKTMTCQKGKSTVKVVGIAPKCPLGYKSKK